MAGLPGRRRGRLRRIGGELVFVVVDAAVLGPCWAGKVCRQPRAGAGRGVQAVASPQVPPERVSPRRIRARRLSAAARV